MFYQWANAGLKYYGLPVVELLGNQIIDALSLDLIGHTIGINDKIKSERKT